MYIKLTVSGHIWRVWLKSWCLKLHIQTCKCDLQVTLLKNKLSSCRCGNFGRDGVVAEKQSGGFSFQSLCWTFCLPNMQLSLRPTSALSSMWRRSENRTGCQDVVECWRNCRHLPAFTHRWRRVSAESETTSSLPFTHWHVGPKSAALCAVLSLPCRILETNMSTEYVTDLSPCCFGIKECLTGLHFRSWRLTVYSFRNSYWLGGMGIREQVGLTNGWLGAEAPSKCQVYRNGSLKTQAPMSQPKALVSESPDAASALPQQWEQIVTTSGSHFTLSPLQEEEEKKICGRGRVEWGGGGGKYFLQCKAERKQSRDALERGRN